MLAVGNEAVAKENKGVLKKYLKKIHGGDIVTSAQFQMCLKLGLPVSRRAPRCSMHTSAVCAAVTASVATAGTAYLTDLFMPHGSSSVCLSYIHRLPPSSLRMTPQLHLWQHLWSRLGERSSRAK